MQISPVSFCGNKEKKQKIKNKGFIRGQMANGAIATAASLPTVGILQAMKKVSKVSKKEIDDLSIASQKGLELTGLKQKGVEIFSIQEDPELKTKMKDLIGCAGKLYKSIFSKNDELIEQCAEEAKKSLERLFENAKEDQEAMDALKTEILSSKKLKNGIPEMNEAIAQNIANMQALTMFKNGSNACYLPHANKIILPSKTLRTSVFHEMGHAMNNNGGMIMKALQKCRPLAKIVPGAVLMVSLLNKRPKNSEKVDTSTLKGKMQNVADKTKKHAGLITGLAMLPMVLEEGIASLRGQGVAKKLVSEGSLSKELFKKIKATNFGGFASYALAATGAVAACELAIKIKDNIQKKYEEKKAMQGSANTEGIGLNAHQG